MIVWRARTTSACVLSLKSGGLHMARWRFQFWFSLPYWLCDLCTRCPGVCGNISSPIPVSFFQCLLLRSTFHTHKKKKKKNMAMTRGCISLILELMAMFLSFQMTINLVTAAVVWAVLESTSGSDPSSDTIAPKHSKLRTVSSFLLSMVMSVLMPLVLFVISWVFSALICMPYAVEVSSRWFTNWTSSCSCPSRPSMSSAKRKFVIVLPPYWPFLRGQVRQPLFSLRRCWRE